MKTLVLGIFDSDTAALRAGGRLTHERFVDERVPGDEVRQLVASHGLRAAPGRVVGVATQRVADAQKLFHRAGAARVMTLPYEETESVEVDAVTEAGLESFPASDPPSWTP